MPWREQTAALFNLDRDDGTPPPELIIQDELHLISGPLGTLAGLYETAIDLLCTTDGVRPKVIASTATIRRAAQQVEALFDRDDAPVPAAGHRRPRLVLRRRGAAGGAQGDRLYVGLMAPGTSQTTLLIRTYAALLHEPSQDVGRADEVRDPYWTLVGYFNSLRVLGGARMQVQDDVDDRLELARRDGDERERSIEHDRADQSRSTPARSRSTCSRMERRAHPDDVALDVVLATNMISVGVDVDRLGLMVVMGQPQTTAEYIQATSRVGRRHPGLVVMLLNAAPVPGPLALRELPALPLRALPAGRVDQRHAVLPRARDRGLHAVFIACRRLTIPGLRDNDAADSAAQLDDAGCSDRSDPGTCRSRRPRGRSTPPGGARRVSSSAGSDRRTHDPIFGTPTGTRDRRSLLLDAARSTAGLGALPNALELSATSTVESSSAAHLKGGHQWTQRFDAAKLVTTYGVGAIVARRGRVVHGRGH